MTLAVYAVVLDAVFCDAVVCHVIFTNRSLQYYNVSAQVRAADAVAAVAFVALES